MIGVGEPRYGAGVEVVDIACVETVTLSLPTLLRDESFDVELALPGDAAPVGRSKSVWISTLTTESGR